MTEIKLILPFPPSNNTYYRNVRSSTLLSEKGREYKKNAVAHLERIGMAGLKLDYPVMVHVMLIPPDKRRRDTDNFLKAPFDALTEAKFWLDDSQVVEHTVRFATPVKPGYAVVRIAPDMQSGFE